MKRYYILIFILLLALPKPVFSQSQGQPELAEISAGSAILIEPFSGRILFEKNAHERRPMASTTKIMTALVATDMCNPNEVLCVQGDCVKIQGSSLYLEETEELTLMDMLYGLLLRSGNDAAVAIGKHVAGDVGHFVSLMNRKAWELGMHDTNFANPHGLDHDEHYSTAADMARLGAAFLRVPLLREICQTEEYVSRELTTGRVRLFINNNKLLARDPRAFGIKIGWTENAGRCLVAAAQANGMELVAVVLDAPDLYSDVSKLFDYGFGQWSVREFIPQGKVMDVVPVAQGDTARVALATAQSVYYPVAAAEEAVSYSVEVEAPDVLQAPVANGDVVGKVLVTVDDCTMEVDLVAATPVPEKVGLWAKLLEWLHSWWRR